MTDEEEAALAKRLPKGARRALLAMTTTPTLPGRDTFNANAAFNLIWAARRYGGLAQYVTRNRRAAYSLTPLGERIRDRLLAQVDRSPEGQDAEERLDVQHESAVGGNADAPKGDR